MIKVFLVYIATLSTGGGHERHYYEMPDLKTCFEAVSNAQIKIPAGGDAETTVALFCVQTKEAEVK